MRYLPREACDFEWLEGEDAEREARAWNAVNAGRPVLVRGRYRKHGSIAINGKHIWWRSAKQAVGVMEVQDLNRQIPNPDTMTLVDMVEWHGLEYTLYKMGREKARLDKDAAAFEAAVARYEARIGRVLAAEQKKLAREKCLK